MNGIELILIALVVYVVAYKLYGGFITKRLDVNNNKETPSHTMYDGVDYCPAKAPVLLGHHFASIAGAGPIVGPVIAAGFGWIPVYLWVVFGAPGLGSGGAMAYTQRYNIVFLQSCSLFGLAAVSLPMYWFAADSLEMIRDRGLRPSRWFIGLR